ncbi:MAG TPA: RHS repeat-associated core domain-containing protein [Pyrinomonadaceae bacterium]
MKKSISLRVVLSVGLSLYMVVGPCLLPLQASGAGAQKAVAQTPPAGLKRASANAANASIIRFLRVPAPQTETLQPGQSATLMPDGRWLLLGGEGADGPSRDAQVKDARDGSVLPLGNGLQQARASHSATLLPDGTVLIFGGVGAGEEVIDSAELFHPDTGQFELLPLKGLTARAHHTATLLTNGQVLIAGGTSAKGEMQARVELWEPLTKTVKPVPGQLQSLRRRHSATLQPDGAVLLWGGVGRDGANLDDGVLYEPKSEQLTWISGFNRFEDENAPYLRASLPEDGTTDVPVETQIALRFSKPLSVTTVNAQTAALKGPQGTVEAKITPAEGGMLAFIVPREKLLEETTYTITLADALDQNNRALTYTMLSFTTERGASSDARLADGEDWIPDTRNMRGDWRSHRPESPWQKMPPLEAAPGVTALAGQVLLLNGHPLANVTLQIGARSARTDNTGRFLLTDLPAGHHVMRLDGATASKPQKVYGVFKIGVDVEAGKTNVLPFTSWMPRLDTEHVTTLPVPTSREVAVTSPYIPGLEVRVPQGAVVRDIDGQPVSQLTITPIPVDRTPFPLPGGVNVPVFFTVQPGASRVIPPRAQVVYPNYGNDRPGTRMNFWNYDPEDKGWYIYGHGTVTSDGRQVMPDPGVVIYEFTGFMINRNGMPPPPGSGPNPGSDGTDGDPVDLATGLFVYDKTDLILPDTMPLKLNRTYRPLDPNSRPFGIGTSHPYELYLYSAQEYVEADLILPNGGRVHFVRISPGSGFTDAEFEHTTTSSPFYRSRLKWNGNGWDLKLKNGLTYVFGDEAPLNTIKDRHGNKIIISRASTNGFGSPTGRVTKLTSSNGRWIEFTYDASNRITQAKDNIGRTVNYTYDASGRLWKVTDPKAGVTEYTYDTSNRMLTIKDARAIVFLTNQYDANGRVIKQTQADSTTYLFAYTLDANGRVTQTNVTNPRGEIRRTTFNADGHTLTDITALGKPEQQSVTYERQAGTNLPLSTTDTLNRKTTYVYDTLGNATEVTRLAGTAQAATLRFTYDPRFNQMASATDALNHTSSFEYDAQGNLTGIVNPLTQRTSMTYNTAGQPITLTDPLQNTVQFEYEGGLLSSVTDQSGRTFRRFLDDAGRLLSVTAPLGQVTRYDFDALNQLVKSTDPLGATTSYTYDANGNVLTVKDGRNNTTTFVYNNMDRLTSRKDPLLKTQTYQYDAAGKLTKHTDRRGKVTTYTYDGIDRIVFIGYGTVTSQQATTYESTITNTYDAGSRLTKVVDTKAGTINFTYDGLDRILSEVNPQGAITNVYDVAGRRTGMTVAGQTAVGYAYDDSNRVTGITQGASSVGLAYDAAGRRTTLTLPNGVSVEYGYNQVSQLTSLKYKKGAELLGDLAYEYDAAGRRTKVGGSYSRTGLPQPLTSATYNAANQVTQRGATNLTYDANGNLTNDGANTYTWDARNKLVSISGATTASFVYDSFGRRVSKTVGAQATSYLYDGINTVQEKVGAAPSANMLVGSLDEVFTRTTSAGTQTLIGDGMGTTLALLDATGAEQTRYTYDPFGAVTQTGGANDNPNKFTGREDDGAGLYYYRARYYSPQQQRFISGDPIGFAGGDANLYAYVGNSPTNYADPSGLILDTLLDIGFIAYDLYKLATGGRKNFWDNMGNLGLDVVGAAVPFLTGLGAGRRALQHGDDVIDAARQAPNCFVAGTLVHTADGARPIEEIKAGDRVLSWNEESRQAEYQKVAQTFVRRAEALILVTVEGAENAPLGTTDEHPFYVHRARDCLGDGDADEDDEGEWVGAAMLRVGDHVRRPAGGWVRVLKVERRAESATVYNFEVENTHTYFVSALGVLVHNSCKTLQPGPHAGESIPARGPQRDFTPQERSDINRIGQETGCHTCGSKDPGTKSGNHIPDHQPPNQLNPNGGPQELYPHCLSCSRTQGGEVRQATRP